MLIYPPGKHYQRGEDRCQGNVEDSAATNLHACNDLGYVASGLQKWRYDIFLKDYMGEGLAAKDLQRDFRQFKPGLLFLTITTATIFQDIAIVNTIKANDNNCVIVLKGALFFDAPSVLLNDLDLSSVDYLVGGESDFVSAQLIHSHFTGESPENIPGIIYKRDDQWIKTDFSTWADEPDTLLFPDRSLMNNKLYIRPDTGELQATIAVARGCSSSCIFCLTPVISGRKIRTRSSDNVFMELLECYEKYGISNFFFKSDTFTLDRKWVVEFCSRIINSKLNGKISWVANSKTKPVETDTLKIMKQAGCWLIAFGFESGSGKTMAKLGKGTGVADSLRSVKCARDAGLKVFGFFMAGFYWETRDDLRKTEKLIFDLKADFIEVHIPVPYPGTALYEQVCSVKGRYEPVTGKDYYATPFDGMKYLDVKEVLEFRKKLLFRYYFRISYIFDRFREVFKRPVMLKNYARYAAKLFYKTITCV